MFAAHEHPNPSKDAHSPQSFILRAFSRSVAHPGTENAVLAKGAALAAPPKTRRKFKKPQVSSPKKKGRKGFAPRKKKCSGSLALQLLRFSNPSPVRGQRSPAGCAHRERGRIRTLRHPGGPGVAGSRSRCWGSCNCMGTVFCMGIALCMGTANLWDLHLYGTCMGLGGRGSLHHLGTGMVQLD